MKKILALALAVLMTATVFSGCSVKKNTVLSEKDLPKKVIGVQLGTTGDIYASDYEKKGSTIERYNKGADAVQSLKQGKIDCVIIDSEPAKVFAEKNSDLKILSDPFAKEDYAICISKSKSDLKTKINSALAQLKTNGTLDKIIANYIGDDTKGKTPYTSPAGTSRANGTLKMATNAEFPPYEYKVEDKVVGIDADLAQAVADVLGMKLEIQDIAFDSIITSVQTGKVDIGVAGMTVTDERLKSIDFTNPYTTATQVIIVRKK